MTTQQDLPAPAGPTGPGERAEQALTEALPGLTTEAFCRTYRLVGDHVLFVVALVVPGTLEGTTELELVLTRDDTEHRFAVPVFRQQRGQWHVELDVLVPAVAVAGGTWRGALDIGGTPVPLREAPSGEDGLLAPVAGLLPASTPPAELSVPPLEDVTHA